MRRETAALAGAVWYGVSAGSVLAQPREALPLRVLVVDQASVSRDTLEHAEHAAARVLMTIGIHVRWTNIDAGEPYWEGTYDLKVNIIAETKQTRTGRRLGVADRSEGHRNMLAYAFYRRTEDLAQLNGIGVSALLGHVLAHEIGHLLLPYASHSPSGLRREEWDRAHFQDMAKGLLTFAPSEAALIRTRVRAITTK